MAGIKGIEAFDNMLDRLADALTAPLIAERDALRRERDQLLAKHQEVGRVAPLTADAQTAFVNLQVAALDVRTALDKYGLCPADELQMALGNLHLASMIAKQFTRTL